VYVGAVLIIPFSSPLATTRLSSPIACWEVLGATVLNRVVERLRASGVSEIAVVQESMASLRRCGDAQFIKCGMEWDDTVARYLNYGLKNLLLIRVGSYVELDIPDFLRFHREVSSPVAQVHDQHGPLDVFAIDGNGLRDKTAFSDGMTKCSRYPFAGYANRLGDAQDFRQLTRDALAGRAGIVPIGQEIAANVWVNDGASIDETAKINGPAYIGKYSRVRAACTLSESSSVEQDCEIDCGTTIDDSCILPHTYVGMGLSVRDAVACGDTLFHLGRNVELQLHDRRLMGSAPARSFFRSLLSTPPPSSGQPTTFNRHL
jgi:NDP-sugar pyrophosphorylase family protein